MSVVYVYALLALPAGGSRSIREPRSIRVCGRRIQLIPIGDIQAAVEQIERPPELSEASLRSQHEIVVALGRRFDPILPVRFGAAVDRAELERLVTGRQARLRRALDDVRGCEQMTVRIVGKEARTHASMALTTTGTAYLTDRHRALRRGLPAAGKRIGRALERLIARERIDPGRGRIRSTLHHLIPRGRAAEYRALVERALTGSTPGEHQVVVSGPWPPFAFTPDLWP